MNKQKGWVKLGKSSDKNLQEEALGTILEVERMLFERMKDKCRKNKA
jgi:hypothetical protein